MDMELIKENIECEQLLSENYSDTVVKAEFVIPDTHPDVEKILILDAKTIILNNEIIQDKVYVEGQVEYNILYLGSEGDSKGACSVTYSSRFSNYIEIKAVDSKLICEASCYVEHMECSIVNERKVSVEGIVKLKAELYKDYSFEVIRDISGPQDIQMLKNNAAIDKIFGSYTNDLIAKSNMKIGLDKPPIGEILKIDAITRNSEVKLSPGRLALDSELMVSVLYRGKETRELAYLEDNVAVTGEFEIDGIVPSMENYTDLNVEALEYKISEDDLGENRLIDMEILIKASTKVMFKDEIDMVEDAYLPNATMKMDKKEYELNVVHGHGSSRSIIKGDIELKSEYPKISKIIMCCGKVMITDKKLVEDKVLAEGVLNVDILCRTFDDEFFSINDEIPFTSAIEMPGSKIDMQCLVKGKLESVEAYIELDHISVKSVALMYSRVNYIAKKDFVVDIKVLADEVQRKKSSIIIYVVQQGDTLWKVAKKYGTTIEGIMNVNNLESQELVRPGDKLIVPGRALI